MKPKHAPSLAWIASLTIACSLSASAAVITFDSLSVGSLGPVNGATTNAAFSGVDGWSKSASVGTGYVVTTATSNEYQGGQALTGGIGTTSSAETYIGGKLGIVDHSGGSNPYVISFDAQFFTNVSATVGLLGDTNANGMFDQTGGPGMQVGFNASGFYYRNADFASGGSGGATLPATTAAPTQGNWYHFNVEIGASSLGSRTINITARDLTLGQDVDLNGTAVGMAWTISRTDAQFGVDPALALGGFVRVDRGSSANGYNQAKVDNIYLGNNFAAVPEPSAALLGGLGLLALLRRRRK